MTDTLILSIDAMGGDHAPESVIEGVALSAKQHDDVFFFLFGNEEKIAPLTEKYGLDPKCYKIHHTMDVVRMDAKPSQILRSGRETSMWKSIMAVRNGYAKAVVSAGNTGALMAMSKICLGTLPGIDRPAIAGVLPSATGPIVVLDLGANTECDAQNLVEFSLMGEVLYQLLFGVEKPTVGLLNIGSEHTKGREEIREAAAALTEMGDKINFNGFVEGNDIGAGKAQVIVADGFSGNIALKTLEGTVKFVAYALKQEVKESWLSMFGFLMAHPSLARFKKKYDPRLYNGAMFLGLKGISVKSHGGADAFGFSCAIESAIKMARNDLCNKIKEEAATVLNMSALDDTTAP